MLYKVGKNNILIELFIVINWSYKINWQIQIAVQVKTDDTNLTLKYGTKYTTLHSYNKLITL